MSISCLLLFLRVQNSKIMVSNHTMVFRAKLGDLWSLCNHMEGPK